MDVNTYKKNDRETVENQATAALFSKNGTFKEFSGVYIPSEQEVISAKEFVDENAK